MELLQIIFLHICTRAMVLDLCLIFASAQDFENKLTEFILTGSRLGFLPVMVCLFVIELWPLIDIMIFFCSISLELEKRCSGTIVRFSDNSTFY